LEKFLTHNFQRATPNPISRLLACFEFVDTHLGWVVKDVAILSLLFATRQSLFAIRRRFLFATRYSLFAAIIGSAGASPSYYALRFHASRIYALRIYASHLFRSIHGIIATSQEWCDGR